MRNFLVQFSILGNHVHCSVFTPDRANCGKLTVRRGDEFRALLNAFSNAHFIGKEDGVGIEEAIKP